MSPSVSSSPPETVAPPVIEQLRLGAFKSFRDAVVPICDLTPLIGRNGSGKSNAIIERDRYSERSVAPTDIWTTDERLAAHA